MGHEICALYHGIFLWFLMVFNGISWQNLIIPPKTTGWFEMIYHSIRLVQMVYHGRFSWYTMVFQKHHGILKYTTQKYIMVYLDKYHENPFQSKKNHDGIFSKKLPKKYHEKRQMVYFFIPYVVYYSIFSIPKIP